MFFFSEKKKKNSSRNPCIFVNSGKEGGHEKKQRHRVVKSRKKEPETGTHNGGSQTLWKGMDESLTKHTRGGGVGGGKKNIEIIENPSGENMILYYR